MKIIAKRYTLNYVNVSLDGIWVGNICSIGGINFIIFLPKLCHTNFGIQNYFQLLGTCIL